MTVTAENKEKVYGDANPAFTATYAGFVNGESLETSGIAGAPSLSTLAGSASHVGSYTISAAVGTLTASNYQFNYVDGSLLVTQKGVTVAGVTAEDKPYDATDAAALNVDNAELIGAIGGDAVTLVTTDADGRFADKNVGSDKTVSVSGITLEGDDAENYLLTQPTVTANITALHISGAFTAESKIYDGNPDAAVLTRSPGAVLGEDVVILTGGTATFATKNVGQAKTVTLSGASLSGDDADNYVLDSVATTTADVTVLHITGDFTAEGKIYDGNPDATVLTRSTVGEVVGDDVTLDGGTAAFDDKNVGDGKPVTLIDASLTGDDAGNYLLVSVATTTADVTPKTLTVSAMGVDKTYDGTPDATVTLDDDRLAGDAIDASYTTADFADQNVGNGKTVSVSGIAIEGADAGNYTLASTTAGTSADITPATLTVTADNQTRVYGMANLPLTASYSGFVDGETLGTSGVSGAPSLGTDATSTSAVNTYAITIGAGSLTASNYDFSFVDGTLSVVANPDAVYVDDGWAGTPRLADPDGEGPATQFGIDAFANIQEAIEAVAAEGTVNVADGTYSENVVINKAVTLDGESRTGTIIDAAKSGAAGIGVEVLNTTDVTIRDLTVRNAGNGLTPDDIVNGPYQPYGILLASTSDSTVENVNLQNNGLYEIFLWDNADHNTLRNLDIDGARNDGSSYHSLDGIFSSGGAIDEGGHDLTNDGNVFDNNLVQHVVFGVSLVASPGSQVSDSDISAALAPQWAAAGFASRGVSLFGSSDAVIRGNTIAAQDIAIRLRDGATNYTYAGGADDNLIEQNVIAGATGIAQVSGQNNVARNNDLSGSTLGISNAGSNLLDASGNWWGTTTAADVAAAAGANVDYTPWLGSGSDTSTAAGFQPSHSSLYVDDDSPQTGLTGSIQEGIDLVTPDGTVNVAAGTYAENQITINKGLTLQGAGAATTIIDGSSASLPDSAGLLYITNVNGAVTVSGFTLENAGIYTYGADYKESVGIKIEGNDATASVNITDNKIIGSDNTTPFDEGVWAYQTQAAITVSGNELTQWWTAVILEKASGAGTVTGNDFHDLTTSTDFYGSYRPGAVVAMTYDGVNVSSPLQINDNEFHDYAGSAVTVIGGYGGSSGEGQFSDVQIHGNSITNTVDADSEYAIAIRNWGDDPEQSGVVGADISNNLLANAAVPAAGSGIVVDGLNPETSIHINSIQGYAIGVENLDATPVDASGNWWGDADGPNTATNPYKHPTSGSTIAGAASVVPWLTDGTNHAASGTPGFYPTVPQDTTLPAVTTPDLQDVTEGNATAIDLGTLVDADSSSWYVTVSWGDGSAPESFYHSATESFARSHTYVDENVTHTVDLTVVDQAGNSSSASLQVTVSEAALSLTATAQPARSEGDDTGTIMVATFTDGNPLSQSGEFVATITWGDGQTSEGTIELLGSSATQSSFSVTGSHAYRDDATVLSVTVSEADNAAASATNSVPVTVTELGVTLTPPSLPAEVTEGDLVSGTVATFTDTNTLETTADFVTTITWGDNHTSAGTITGSNGSFTISGDHTYANDIADGTLTVAVSDRSGDLGLTSRSVSLTVAEAPLTDFVAIAPSVTEGVLLNNELVATFTDPQHAVAERRVCGDDYLGGQSNVGRHRERQRREL